MGSGLKSTHWGTTSWTRWWAHIHTHTHLAFRSFTKCEPLSLCKQTLCRQCSTNSSYKTLCEQTYSVLYIPLLIQATHTHTHTHTPPPLCVPMFCSHSLQSQAHADNPKNPVPKFRVSKRPERPVSGMSKSCLSLQYHSPTPPPPSPPLPPPPVRRLRPPGHHHCQHECW